MTAPNHSDQGGSRVVNASFAVVIALVGMFASYCFIDRHALIKELGSNASVPLWDSFRFARALVSAGFDANPSGRIFTFIASVLAGTVGYKETHAASRVAAWTERSAPVGGAVEVVADGTVLVEHHEPIEAT